MHQGKHRKKQRNLSIWFLAGMGLLLLVSCTRQLFMEQRFQHVAPNERLRLHDFFAGGTQKSIGNHKLAPSQLINTASEYLGVPHCMGGTTHKCLDCSGLLVTVFARHGIELPHNSEEQARFGTIIADRRALVSGDLVFFIRTYKTNRFITHSGIYVGDNQFIHTSSSKGVMISSLEQAYWDERFVFGTRVLE